MNLNYLFLVCFLILGTDCYQLGQKYEYEYQVYTTQSLSSRDGAKTWSRMKLEVTPTAAANDDLTLRFKINSVTTNFGEFSEPTEQSNPSFGLSNAFVASYNKGRIVEARLPSSDGKWAKGLKKSLISLFQVQQSDSVAKANSFSVLEDSPTAECETAYTFIPGSDGFNVTKIRDYHNCTNDLELFSRRFTTPSFYKCTLGPEYFSPWTLRSTMFRYKLSNDKIIKGLMSSEKVTFMLFGHKSSTTTEIKGVLRFISASASSDVEIPSNLVSMPKLSGRPPHSKSVDFESTQVNLAEGINNPGMWPKPADPVNDIAKTMTDMASRIESGLNSATLSGDLLTMDFIELHLTLSRLNLDELQAIYGSIKDRSDDVPKIFLNALKYTPTNAAFSFMKTFVKSNQNREKLALRGYFQLIPFRELHVSRALLDEYLELCKQSVGTGLEKTCFLSFSNILQSHCNPPPQMTAAKPGRCNAQIASKYFTRMIDMIRSVIPASDDRDMLENSISSNVLIEEASKIIIERINDPRLIIRRTATVSLFGMAHVQAKTIRSLLWAKILDRNEDHVVRIYSILVYVKTNPSLSQFRSLIKFLSSESEDEQVTHYTISLLKMMKSSPNPCYAPLARLSRIGLRDMMAAIKGRFHHSNMALSSVYAYEAFDKDFGFGGGSVLSYILNKRTMSASFYLEENMNVNGFTGGNLALLWETFPEEVDNGTAPVPTEPKSDGLDEASAAIAQKMKALWSASVHHNYPKNNKMRLSFMLSNRVVDVVDPQQFTEIAAFFEPSITTFSIPVQGYKYASSEHGYPLFSVMVSSWAFYARLGPLSTGAKPDPETLFRAALSPNIRRDTGVYTISGLKSPLGQGRSGIMTSVQRIQRLPLNISYAITKKSAELKFALPAEQTDLIWYRMNAAQFQDKSNSGSIRSGLKPLFVDGNGQSEQDYLKSKTFWSGFLGNGLRADSKINRPTTMDGAAYRYMLLENSLRNDDARLIRMKFEYGAIIVPIDWKLTYLPDAAPSELVFSFNRSAQVTDESRSGEYNMIVGKNSQTIISTKLFYSYSLDSLSHTLRLYYHNHLKNIHTCLKGDAFAPKVNFARYTSTDVTYNPEDKIVFNGSVYFDEACSKKDISFKGEFTPSEQQKNQANIALYKRSCGANGISVNKIPFCSGLHYHTSELRSAKIAVTAKDVPEWFTRWFRVLHNKGIQKHGNQIRYRINNEVTDPSTTLVTANSTWFWPYKYNVSYKMLGREEFWHNIPSTGAPWPNTYRLFDWNPAQALHRTFRRPYCYVQTTRLRVFDEWSGNLTIKPSCLRTLAMDCTSKNSFQVLFSQDAEGKLESIEIYQSNPVAKVEVNTKSGEIKVNGNPVSLSSDKVTSVASVKISDNSIYKRISLAKGSVRVYFDDVGLYVSASKRYFSQLCGLCGNMNSCHHDDLHSHGDSDHHGGHSHDQSLWIVKDDRNTAKGCNAQ